MTSHSSQPTLRRIWFRLLATWIATFGLLPGLSGSFPHLMFGSFAYAQSAVVNPEEVKIYAQIIRQTEPVRQTAYNEIKKINNGDVPNIVCYDTKSLASLATNIRTIAVNFCNQYKQNIQRHGMTISRFNEITVQQQSDPDLRKKIQDELTRSENSP